MLALILVSTIVVSALVIFFAIGFLRQEIIAILPENSVFGVDTRFRELLLLQGAILIASAVILTTAMFVIIGDLVARPLKQLSLAMNVYVENGERTEITAGMFTPKEVRSLQHAFTSFVDRVEAAHKRDTDISRMKSDFISTAAHQLRTPLTGIRWALEALEKENITPEQKALVTSAVGKSKDLVTIVGTLLDISSIESGKYHYKFEQVDMGALCTLVAQDLAQTASSRGVSLFFARTDDAVVPPARADRERIKWVISNLVENAIRYTPQGGTVQLSIATGKDRLFIRVRDTGIGIPQSDRANIFERFYRAGNAVQKENGGSGLGLYIARSVATDHGGDLSFEANEGGVGTTFTLSLPVAV